MYRVIFQRVCVLSLPDFLLYTRQLYILFSKLFWINNCYIYANTCDLAPLLCVCVCVLNGFI